MHQMVSTMMGDGVESGRYALDALSPRVDALPALLFLAGVLASCASGVFGAAVWSWAALPFWSAFGKAGPADWAETAPLTRIDATASASKLRLSTIFTLPGLLCGRAFDSAGREWSEFLSWTAKFTPF